jgi:type IV pilus assembly protein PilO
MKIGPREQIIISGVGIAVVVAVLVVVLLLPQFQQRSSLDAQVSSASAESSQQKAQLATLEESKSRAAETDAHWLRLENLVPENPDLPSLIVELQDTAFASGVQILTVTPSAPSSGAEYYTIPIKMDIAGTWADTVDFLQRVYKLNRGIRLVSSTSSVTNNTSLATQENAPVPDYSEMTSVELQAYMIPASSAASSTATTSTGQ